MQETKKAFGHYLGGYYTSLVPTTPAMTEFCARGLKSSIVYAPGRMIDAAEEMLAAWRRNDNNGQPGSSAFLPVMIVALAKDYVPVSGDFSRQVGDDEWITVPEDEKGRIFKLRQMQGDRRAQLLIAAAEEESARSLAAQFCLWVASVPNRRFYATYRFAGLDHQWPVMIENIDTPAQSIQTDEKNLTLLVVDVMLRESIPLFRAPKGDEPNDGKGDGSLEDPNGYPYTRVIRITDEVVGTEMQVDDTYQVPIFGGGAIAIANTDDALTTLINSTMPSHNL